MPAVLALAALLTGVFWLVAAWSGLARHVSRDVIHGIVLGLGIALIVAGLRRIEGDAVLGGASVVLALVLLGRGGWLTMPAPQWPAFNQPGVWLAAIGLAAAQIPLTFGNAILGIVAETRRLFPAVVDESRMARGTGFMNLLAGGLGAVLLFAGLFASAQLAVLLGMLPAGTIGAMLFVAGFSLTIGTAGSSRDKEARAVLLTTAAVSVWNAGVGVVVGVLLEAGLKSRVMRI